MTPAERLAEIRERLMKATPAPWNYIDQFHADQEKYFNRIVSGAVPLNIEAPVIGYQFKANDGEFIAHAPSDLAWLIDLVEKMQLVIHAATQVKDILRPGLEQQTLIGCHEILKDALAVHTQATTATPPAA